MEAERKYPMETATAVPMARADAEEFTEALGQVVAGGWRLSFHAWKLGVPQALGMSHDEWVTEKLGGYVRLGIPERREVVGELTEEGMSTREIGDVLGVDNKTVHNDQKAAVESSTEGETETAPESSQTADAVESSTEGKSKGQLANQKGGSDAWSTPRALFDKLDAEFRFTVDVCALPSSAKCERFFTPEDDGLAQEWTGTCWMNPPYDEIDKWVGKAHRSGQGGATVVCLVPARTDTGWWWDHCRFGEVRFLRGRLKFGGSSNSAPFPSAVVVFGPRFFDAPVKWWDR